MSDKPHTPMSSSGFNRVRAAQIMYEQTMENELREAGWSKCWRKKNNMTYWTKLMPVEGWVTATSAEEALKWEYEL